MVWKKLSHLTHSSFFLWHFTAFEQGPAPTFGHLTYFEDLVRTTSGESVTPVGAHTVALTLLFCVQFTYPRLPIWSFCFSVSMVFIIPKGTWGNHYYVLWKPWNHTLPFCGTLLTPHPLLFMPIHSTKDAAFWKAASSARAGVHIHTAPYGHALTHILPTRPVRIFFQHNWSGHCRIEMHINAAIRASATAACNVKACKLISNSCHRRAKCSIQYLIMVHNNHSNSHVVGHTE